MSRILQAIEQKECFKCLYDPTDGVMSEQFHRIRRNVAGNAFRSLSDPHRTANEGLDWCSSEDSVPIDEHEIELSLRHDGIPLLVVGSSQKREVAQEALLCLPGSRNERLALGGE